ncbi:hypothetical protein TrCOL_g9964 [Triparma columacea]|uniref:N-acetyltransferase domain-containing protein n=1 Tax=Triparma columacea TaxID=722753 RepID=A0A9W7G7N8_9STRA|nr:hypothetical protein TrCOL_g9964 [Triparma columacea]
MSKAAPKGFRFSKASASPEPTPKPAASASSAYPPMSNNMSISSSDAALYDFFAQSLNHSPPTTTTTNTPNPMEKPKPSAGKEKSFDGFNFSIEWTMRQDGSTGPGITNVLHYTGTVKAEHRDGTEEDCGEIHCTKILRNNMMNDGESCYDTCDCVSSELERVAHLVRSIDLGDTDRREDETDRDRERAKFQRMMLDKTVITAEDGEFVNEVGDKWEITQGDILYVSKVKVKEEYRGMGLGLFLLDAADKQLNSYMSLTLLVPFPLVYDENRRMDRSNLKADMKRLAAYYGRLGFGSLGWPESSGSWFVARWNGYNKPKIETVCPLASQFY